MEDLIEHCKYYLGEFDDCWQADEPVLNLEVIRFKDKPYDDINTYMSIGFSDNIFVLRDNKEVRYELLLSLYAKNIDEINLTSIVINLCEYIYKNNISLFRGTAIKIPQMEIRNSSMNSLYFSIPIFFDDNFYTYKTTSPTTIIVWVIPIYSSEFDFIIESGWKKFEDMIDDDEIDMWDIHRLPIV